MLVGYYGKGDYGLIALAFSLNAYLRLMDLGMNVGSIRFFSMWISKGEWEKIGKVSRSSIVFYGVIGTINAVIFFIMAQYGSELFNISESQQGVFKVMMYILALSTILNWISNVITQLLSAYNELSWINKVTFVSSLFNFVTAFIAIKYHMSLTLYFFLYTLSTLIVVPLNTFRLKVYNKPIFYFLRPKWDGVAFKEILGYSVAIFAMGIFQVTANNLRPLLLGKFSDMGVEVLTEYRVMQTIIMLILAIGGVFMQVLLPSTSKIYAENDVAKLEKVIYTGTKYISIFFSLIVFVLIANSHDLLVLYMGQSYAHLTNWLIIWLLTVLLSMHNAPVASLVLSTGKTKFLVYSSAVSCILSLPITMIFAKSLNVGAAVVGYFVYVILQLAFYYVYYIPRILKLNSFKIFFKSFLPSVIVGSVGWGGVILAEHILILKPGFVSLISNSLIFGLLFGILTIIFLIRPSELNELKVKLLKKG